MIPVSLKLSNFTSYGSDLPELDFTNFHMAVITGSNGVGKSSILDAITWCVWGWSRAGDSADQLVRLGSSDMYVEFAFNLDDHIYTVKRRRSTKSGGSTALELWSNSHNLTEGTIKATQQKIINTLHLTYETFTNSSFLRQGHADEFTTKGPTDRKRILADILGLDHYDLLEEKAKEKAKEVQTKLQLLDYQLLEIDVELSQKEEREKALSRAEEEAKTAVIELKEVEKTVRQIEEEKQNINSVIQSLKEKKTQIEIIQTELQQINLQIDIKKKAQEEFAKILEQKTVIEEKYAQLQKLQDEKKILETKRSELIKVKNELADVQKILIAREEKRAKATKDLEVEIKKYSTENEQMQNQINHLKMHKDTCPTCGQNIGEGKNKQIISQNEKKIEDNDTKIKDLHQKLEKYQKLILPEQIQSKKLEEMVVALEKETKDWTDINQNILLLEKYSGLYIKLSEASSGVKAHQEAILDMQKIYNTKQQQIEKVKTNLEELINFEEKLSLLQDKLEAKQLLKQELANKALELRGQVGEAKQLVSRAKQLEKFKQQKEEEKDQFKKEKEAFEQLALAFGKKGIQAMIIETAIPEIEDEANNLLNRLTEGRMQVRFETQRETKTKVATAAGKSYALVETLDIIISDEMGERPYEMYSGGEAFRVNFAIRLALSKLLTRRAGAKLQFLVIDEGFGTQDVQGRSRIVGVLDTIKDDFEKIIIITHLEELKEEFPVRIEVSKNSNGSTFAVFGA